MAYNMIDHQEITIFINIHSYEDYYEYHTHIL